MRTFLRRAGISCIFSALALLLLVIPAGAQDGIKVIGSGGSDELVAPPSPTCDDLVLLSEVTFSEAGVPLSIPRMGVGDGLVTSYDVPNFEPVGAGTLVLDEVITFDGHVGRDIWPAQPNERVQFEFLLDGVSQVITPFTPDLPDDTLSAWLDLDMGAYQLPNGADALRILHYNDPGNTDSVVVSALCGRLLDPDDEVPGPDPTVAPTTDVATTVAPSTVVPTTVAPTTVLPTTTAPTTTAAPTTTVPPTTSEAPTTTVAPTTIAPSTTAVTTEVEGTVEERAQLAATGANDLGIALFAAGLVLVGSALLAWSKDLEELLGY
jgi:hypothetical protein